MGSKDEDEDDQERCIACGVVFKNGDMVHVEQSGGYIHADCCSPEPESYVGADGSPLSPTDPIPQPWAWFTQ